MGVLLMKILSLTHTDIYAKSLKIVETYFNGEEDVEDNLAPNADLSAQQFQFGTTSDQPNVFQFGGQ